MSDQGYNRLRHKKIVLIPEKIDPDLKIFFHLKKIFLFFKIIKKKGR